MAVRFINVDLDLESKGPLDYLCLELSRGKDVHHMHCGPNGRGYSATLECANGGETCEAESVIHRFCEVVESLNERAMGEWKAAHLRTFDIGYEVSGSDLRWKTELRQATLTRVVALGACIVFTVYPVDGSKPSAEV
jgi:hypothetical protein